MEQVQLLSDEAYNLAEQHQLGKPLNEFPNLIEAENLRKGRNNIRIGIFLSWLFVSVIFIGLAALTYFITQPVPYGPEPADTFFIILSLAFFSLENACSRRCLSALLALSIQKALFVPTVYLSDGENGRI